MVVESAIPDFSPEVTQALWPQGFPGLAREHAALIETSLWMWHEDSAVRTDRMRPDAPERIVAYDVIPIDPRMTTASGSLSSPMESTAEKGTLIADVLTEYIISIVDQEFPAAGAEGN